MSQKDSQEIDHLHQQITALTMERTILWTLLDTLPFFAYARDAEGRFLFSNQAHRMSFGVSSIEEVRGKTDYDFFFAEEAAGYVAGDQRVITTRQPLLDYEEPNTDADGQTHWLMTNKYPVLDDQGNCIGLCGTTRDVTERKAQQELIEAQKEALHELSTPIIPIMDRILVMPLIGGIDTARARDIMRTLLAGISNYRAKIVILDITGVPVVDSGVAEHLNKTIQAAQLKGASTIITGISDAVAETIVDLGINWENIETLRDLQSGLLSALQRMGIHLDYDSAGNL